MTTARWWVLVGLVLIVVGVGELWSPWALVIGGVLLVWLGQRTDARNEANLLREPNGSPLRVVR